MTSKELLEIKGSPAVQGHLNMLQGIIDRLSRSNANCKNWLIGILSAVIVFSFDKDITIDRGDFWICYIPTCLFFFLNCYYLGKQRQFIEKQNEFIGEINEGTYDFKKLYIGKESINNLAKEQRIKQVLRNIWKDLKSTFWAIFSFSTLVFYGVILVVIYIITK